MNNPMQTITQEHATAPPAPAGRRLLLLPLLLVVFFAFALLAGCGRSDTEEIIVQSAQAMNGLSNYKGTVEMDLRMAGTARTTAVRMNTAMDVFTSPFCAKLLITSENRSGDTTRDYLIDGFVVSESDRITLYMDMGDSMENPWVKNTFPYSEALVTAYSPARYSQLFLDALEDVVSMEDVSINGTGAWKIDVTLRPAALIDVLHYTNGAQSITASITAESLSGAAPVPASLWIEKDTYYLVQAEMELTSAFAPAFAAFEVNLHVLSITATVSDIGRATDFTYPEALRTAPEGILY